MQKHIGGWGDLAKRLEETLEAIAALGVSWRHTRFDHYLNVIRRLGELDKPTLLARPSKRLEWEALLQAIQLSEAAALFPSVPPEILAPKLETIMSGADVHQSSDVTISRPGRAIEVRGVEGRIVSHPA